MNKKNFIFTTLCISDSSLDKNRSQFKGTNHYFEVANILVHSVLKYTEAKIIVVTDVPNLFLSNDRVIVYDIKNLTKEPLIFCGYCNYHLKRFALKKAFEQFEKYSIYLDCDVFLNDMFSDNFIDYLDNIECDVIGRFGASTIQSLLDIDNEVAKLKVKEFGSAWKNEYLKASQPNETFFIFKKNTEKQNIFLQTWDEIATESLKNDKAIYADSYYIGASVLNSKMKILNMDSNCPEEIRKIKYLLNIIHCENINNFDFLAIEPYDYKKTLNKLK